MPLHLLGKKSWNVYNPANIERVKRDEAEASRQASEREERALQDEADARIQLLRGKGQSADLPRELDVPNGEIDATYAVEKEYEAGLEQGSQRLVADADTITSTTTRTTTHRPPRTQTRRLAGEDDTDRDIRLARETQLASSTSMSRTIPTSTSTSTLKRQRPETEDSIVDAKGNISLIPIPEPELKKARIEEDPYTVYLSHAAGRGKDKGSDKPWYSSVPGENGVNSVNSVNGADNDRERSRERWGQDTPRRRERATARMAADDPLAAIKKGVKQLREAERSRNEWRAQRERDLREVEDLAAATSSARKTKKEKRRHSHSHQHRYRGREEDIYGDENPDKIKVEDDDQDKESIESFNLDKGYSKSRDRDRNLHDHNHDHHRHRHRHHHQHHHEDEHHRHHRHGHRHHERDRDHGREPER